MQCAVEKAVEVVNADSTPVAGGTLCVFVERRIAVSSADCFRAYEDRVHFFFPQGICFEVYTRVQTECVYGWLDCIVVALSRQPLPASTWCQCWDAWRMSCHIRSDGSEVYTSPAGEEGYYVEDVLRIVEASKSSTNDILC